MSPGPRRAVRGAALAVVAAVAGLTATALARPAFTMYDEGVYYFQAVLFARGEVPYRDFFCPQPPGVLLVGALSERIGAGLTGVRAVSWLCGLVLLAQTYRLTGRLTNEGGPSVAAVLVAVTVVFAYQSIQGATNMPAAALETAACLLVVGGGRNGFVAAGLVLAAATVFRLPAVVATPGLVLLGLFAHGRSGFWPRAAWLLGALGIACAAIHLTLAAAVPGYFDNVFGFQTARVRTDWADRGGQVWELLSEPVALLGLPAALGLAVFGGGVVRGVAVHALVTTAAVTVAGNALSVMYYLPVLPLLAACAARALVRAARPRPWALAAVIGAVAVVRGPWVATVVLAQVGPDDEHAACVAILRTVPGAVVLTSDGRIAVLAGKRVVPGYYATDPNALHLVAPERFHAWFAAALPRADTVVVTPQLMMWMSPANAAAVRTGGKPVLFDTEGTRAAFVTTYGPVP
ncbi:glycosyltransferase family 39 protein [Frigoriglobus tundricola]|uniref:Glycosyltransferase RgtA/B/C/D-like domain-containing protein n=1 Tax=Frigoriglobus tundricola TaxID=2774151 RepID=A0A6M5YUZ7_9BACT|nr:glycosyltransferase family 39 protein [Frigoriglobus tundricola]QJW96712.1 hypothetical protein FTUN_4271 [Frigoriglobus tundricola]